MTNLPNLPVDVEHVQQFGFCGDLARLDRLSPPYDVVHELAQNAPQLLQKGHLASQVQKLPVLEDPVPTGELELAKTAYSFLTQAYVWEPARSGHGAPRTVVPPQLAKPLVAHSERLDEPPAYLYVDHTVRNSRLKDPTRPPTMENLRSIYTFSGTVDEDQFVVVHTAYEHVGLPAIRAAVDMVANRAPEADLDSVVNGMTAIIADMRREFLKVTGTVEPGVFRDKVRLYLMGWHKNVPGLRYDGVEIEASALRGETGAGSALVPFLDRFASVINSNPTVESDNAHLRTYLEFDHYRPKWHRNVLDWMASASQVRDWALHGRIQVGVYNEFVEQLVQLRRDHLRNVGAYLRGSRHPNMQGGYGSGGSNYAAYLQYLAERSHESKITI